VRSGVGCAPVGASSGDAVTTVEVAGANNTALFITDGDDYDNDTLVGGVELCSRGATNTDPDGDLVAGVCDVTTAGADRSATWDNDADGSAATGDRAASVASLIDGSAPCLAAAGVCDNDVDGDKFINNVDNCEHMANPDQEDNDADGVGDPCDIFDTVDNLQGGLPAGKGQGTGLNTSDNIDNDLNCVRTWTTGVANPLAPATCSAVDDANDDGTIDTASNGSDEDGDGFSDADEVNNSPATNPLDPNAFPACFTNPTGAAGGTDSDNDHLLD
jgi:hypothetical protein